MKSGLYQNNNLINSWQNLVESNLIALESKNNEVYLKSVSASLKGYLVIDNSVSQILEYAFKYSALDGVYIPYTVNYLNYCCFSNSQITTLDFENEYGWSHYKYEAIGEEERFHDYNRPSMGMEIVTVYDFVLKPVSRLGENEKYIMLKKGDRFENNQDYLSIFYSTIVSNKVEKDFYEALNNVAFKNWLYSVLPEVHKAQNQQQNTPWHVYNVFNHILFTVKYVNQQTGEQNYRVRQLLALSAFLHDLGKPSCASKKQVGSNVYDTFKGHAKKGVEIIERVLKHFKVNSEEQKIIEFLVENHDFLMEINVSNINVINVNTIKNVVFKKQNDLENLDKNKLLLYLFILSLADNMAQNLDLTTKNVALLSKLKKEI